MGMGVDFPTSPAPWNLDADMKEEGQDSSVLSCRGLNSLWRTSARSLSQNVERQGALTSTQPDSPTAAFLFFFCVPAFVPFSLVLGRISLLSWGREGTRI